MFSLSKYQTKQRAEDKCATSSCLQRQEENDFVVQMFRLSLQSRGPFSCFVSAQHDDEALMYKVYQLSTIFNALFWPLSIKEVSS
ncbi:unnamed protein product [Taenia asiatica]|uniref:Ovule protein n=1 Tax=Taenia asiatica TaxID=60517 RepID=A0A158R864_TAEAS|nr:unnamed protein product [Taenia asiatica]